MCKEKEEPKWWGVISGLLALVSAGGIVLSVPLGSILLFCYGVMGIFVFGAIAAAGDIDIYK
jgi:hypothetical protein